MQSKIKSFRDLIVWQKAKDLSIILYKETNQFPREEVYGLTSQMRRAAISISSNIAEGFKRNSNKEKIQFYTTAYGSLAELESQVEISHDLKYLPDQSYNNIIDSINETARLLDGILARTQSSHPGRFSRNTSLGIVAVFIPVFYVLSSVFSVYSSAAAPVKIFIFPDASEVNVGEIIKSEIRIDTNDTTINAVDIKIYYDPNSIWVLSAERANSIIDLWVEEPRFSPATGLVTFTGGKSTGFSGQGVIGQVYWRALSPGQGTLRFDESSAVLLYDGKGTKAELELRTGTYILIAPPAEGLPRLSSSSHEDENKWYTNRTVHLKWEADPQVKYSYVVTHNPLESPDDIPDEPVGGIKLNNLADGIYYFRLKQTLGDGTWSAAVSRQIKIDATLSEQFEAKVSRDTRLFENKYFLSFNATDAMSGLAYYEIKEGDATPEIVAQGPYVLKQQKRNVSITVRAFDKAGNDRTVVIQPLPLAVRLLEYLKVNFYLVVSLAIAFITVALLIIKRRLRS